MRADIVREVWNPAPDRPKPLTLKQYAEGWLASRTLEARTRGHYRRLLDLHLLPQLGDHLLTRLSPQVVREWHAGAAS
jgi:hypothetical protein